MFIAVVTFTGHKSVPFNRKPYKMFYIGGFIMKTIKENIDSKKFKKLIINYWSNLRCNCFQ